MPFNITSTVTALYQANSTAPSNSGDTESQESGSSALFGIAQIKTTQYATLYGIEVSCQNGFTSDPSANIYVFNNPAAAKAFVETIAVEAPVSSEETESSEETTANYFDWDSSTLQDGSAEYDETIPGMYLVTYGHPVFDTHFDKVQVLGISGCAYCDHPKPFFTNTERGFAKRQAYLTVVVVFNEADNITDNSVLIRGIFETS